MEKIFDTLYSRLLLRDIISKVFPGSMVLITLGFTIVPLDEMLIIMQRLPFYVWIIFFGAAWTLAFAIQSIGEFTGTIQYWKIPTDNPELRPLLIKFNNIASEQHAQQFERLIVIREACGNTYVAMVLCLLILSTYSLNNFGLNSTLNVFKDKWPLLLTLFTLIGFLARMHFKNVQRLDSHISAVIESSKGSDDQEHAA